MKLDSDCVRDVLLAMEDCPFNNVMRLPHLHEKLPQYSLEEIWYTCLKLDEGGYISAVKSTTHRSYQPEINCVIDITYQGHDFLNTIRDPSVWAKTKHIAKAAGNSALKSLWNIAFEIAKTSALELINR